MDNESPWDPTHAGGSRPGRPAMLRGIKRQHWRAGPEAARQLGRELADRGEIAYWAFAKGIRPKANARISAGARGGRCASLSQALDGRYRFVCECRICDRSPTGLKLALARDVALPPRLAVHIDETCEVRGANVIWRRGSTVGVRLREVAPADALRPAIDTR